MLGGLASACYRGADADPTEAGTGADSSPDPAASSGGTDAETNDGGWPLSCEGVELDPGPTLARRLAPWEYASLVRDALDTSVEPLVRDMWPPQVRMEGLTVMAEAQTITLTDVQAFASIAEAVAESIEDARLVDRCGADEATCPELVAEQLGEALFRGPLTSEQIDRFAAPMRDGLADGEPLAVAARRTLRALLQSGSFLYRLETEREGDALQPLEAADLAVRLSFLVWGTGPDDELRAAAADGSLDDVEGIRVQVQRMLEDPRAEQQSLHYVADWLGIAGVERSNVAQAYDGVDTALLEEMKAETLEFARELLWDQRAPLASLLTEHASFMGPRLAQWYGLTPAGEGVERYEFPPERAGLLTHGAVLAQAAGSEQSMISRGLYVLENILCEQLPPLPDDVDTSDDGSAEADTQREASEVRLGREACATCHKSMEPLAHALERFDGAGRYFERSEAGHELRRDGVLTISGTGEQLEWETTEQFMQQLAQTEAVTRCFVRKPLSFSLGRPVHDVGSDACVVDELTEHYLEDSSSYPALIEAIATHPVFRTARPLGADEDQGD